MNHPLLAAFIGASLFAVASHAKVVINEIFYHAPGEMDSLQWIELHNTADQSADIGGWRLKKGAKYEFPAGATISKGGFLILALEPTLFEGTYQKKADGRFTGPLKRKGDRIELTDAGGSVVDAVKFGDSDPWPAIADGESSSLERICPDAPGDDVANWAPSVPDPDLTKPMGTPGKANATFSKVPLPVIGPVKLSAELLKPGQALEVTATVKSAAEVKEVSILYRRAGPGRESPPQTVPMVRGDAGTWTASLPNPEACIVRLQVRAVDSSGGVRLYPSDNDLQPALSVAVLPPWPASKIPQISVWQSVRKASSNPNEFTREDQQMWEMQNRFRTEASLNSLWSALTLTNDLAPGQLAGLSAIFKKQFAERNRAIRNIFGTEDFGSVAPTVNASLVKIRADAAAALEPKLSPAQKEILAKWVTPSRNTPPGGFDVDELLRNWVNYDFLFFRASAVEGMNEDSFRKLRGIVNESVGKLTQIRDEARTAFQSGENQDKVQKKIEEISSSLVTRVEELLGDAINNPANRIMDEAMVFRRAPRAGRKEDAGKRERTAFLHADPVTGATTLIDFASVVPRSAGYKVHFPKGRKFDGMSSINLVFEQLDRFALAEPFAFEVYRRVGMKVPKAGFARFTLDGNEMGYHVLIEQPNRTMLRRNGLDDGGHLYKATWRGETAVDMHEKKTRVNEGSEDLEKLVNGLQTARGDAQWEIIRTNFNVPQVIDYYAVNMLLSHWDGYFNNYFLYHDTEGSGRWTMYPWDQDKACGSYDGQPPGRLFAELPLDYGSWNSKAPGWTKAKQPRTFIEYYRLPDAAQWWRQPGWLSGPMLANPKFRSLFVSRVKQLVETEFTEAKLTPILDSYAAALAEEVRFKSGTRGMDAAEASRQMEENIRLLKGFIKDRRNFLLADPELKAAGPYDPSQAN